VALVRCCCCCCENTGTDVASAAGDSSGVVLNAAGAEDALEGVVAKCCGNVCANVEDQQGAVIGMAGTDGIEDVQGRLGPAFEDTGCGIGGTGWAISVQMSRTTDGS